MIDLEAVNYFLTYQYFMSSGKLYYLFEGIDNYPDKPMRYVTPTYFLNVAISIQIGYL